jgi:hypothetical protein
LAHNNLCHRFPCSFGSNNLQIHLVIKAKFRILELIIPRPLWSFGWHTSGQLT